LKIKLTILCLLFLFSCKEATITPWIPPVSKPTPYDSLWGEYFPNYPGTTWQYDIKVDGQNQGTLTISIEKRILIFNTVSVSLWNFDQPYGSYSRYTAIIEDSVFFYHDINNLKNNEKKYKSYILPLDNYLNWDVRILDQSFGSDRASGGSNIGTIKVPAGIFNNVYEIEHITDAKDKKANEWINFVPGVGMIRMETLDNNTNKTTILELRSYQIKKPN
jgi:hypothetical protein